VAVTELTPTALDARRGRVARVRDRMGELGVDVLLLSHGADTRWTRPRSSRLHSGREMMRGMMSNGISRSSAWASP